MWHTLCAKQAFRALWVPCGLSVDSRPMVIKALPVVRGEWVQGVCDKQGLHKPLWC